MIAGLPGGIAETAPLRIDPARRVDAPEALRTNGQVEGPTSGQVVGAVSPAFATPITPVEPAADAGRSELVRAGTESVITAQMAFAPESEAPQTNAALEVAEAYRAAAAISEDRPEPAGPVAQPEIMVSGIDGTVQDPNAGDPFTNGNGQLNVLA